MWADIVAGIFKPISDVIDHVLPSGDAKLQLQAKVLEGQMAAAAQAMEYERQLLDSQTKIITAEAQGGSWLQRNWRPLSMVTFLAIIVYTWFTGPPPHMSEAVVLEIFGLMKLGLGGYVIGRSAEKVAGPAVTAIVTAMKK